ncbi:hypothetical protein GJ654_14310 [Rhodoblastus acidophilus]|uniref:Uncharacterized protein n=1 Tax=Rhodoblastus acidophilus TaxID=1074 RepID=A0A6N8DNV2_RHOAC|nr:hypothetical protein [Rhodoblastus acidophilus]MCW2275193.1 hypothetical protein [Rhodoblastus acidophilus]MTV32159.1 hypothetical protein [Rhodoblastus acidophilus]
MSISVLAGVGLCAALGFGVFFLATALIGLAIPAWTILPLGAVLVLVVAAFDFFDWW